MEWVIASLIACVAVVVTAWLACVTTAAEETEAEAALDLPAMNQHEFGSFEIVGGGMDGKKYFCHQSTRWLPYECPCCGDLYIYYREDDRFLLMAYSDESGYHETAYGREYRKKMDEQQQNN